MVEATNMTAKIADQLQNEPVSFSGRVTKLASSNVGAERFFVLTDTRIWLFVGDKLNRKHRIRNIHAIIRSSLNDEILLVFPTSKDLRF